jgi:hypothetical protein
MTPSGDTTDDTTIGDTFPTGERDPFDELSGKESEKRMRAAAEALKRMIPTLEVDEDRIHAQLFLEGVTKPKDVAKIVGASVKHVNLVKARYQRRLAAFLENDPDVAAWRADDNEGE